MLQLKVIDEPALLWRRLLHHKGTTFISSELPSLILVSFHQETMKKLLSEYEFKTKTVFSID